MKSLKPCHSEASNISVTSKESPTKKAKEEEDEQEEESNTKHETRSRVMLHLEFKPANNELTNKENSSSKKSKSFICSFCGREFSTSQALGGHQNAHKQERALVKHRHNMVDMTAAATAIPSYGHRSYSSYYPTYSTVPHQLPFYGGLNRLHGVRPYYYHNSWPSSTYDKISRAYSLGPSSSSKLDDGNFQSRALNLGINPNPNPNPTTIDNACNAATIKAEEGGDSNHQRLRFGDDDVNDQHDASGLDLDLKL